MSESRFGNANGSHQSPTVPIRRRPLSNRSRSDAFRNEVILFLRDAGFPLAHRPDPRRGASKSTRIAQDKGDIIGLPYWTVAVRAQQCLDLSGAADEVATEARRAGRSLYASIQRRRGHVIEESYVTMPLRCFVRVLARNIATNRAAQ